MGFTILLVLEISSLPGGKFWRDAVYERGER